MAGVRVTPLRLAADDVAGFLAIAGIVGVVPYALWAVIAVAATQPTSEADYRRLSWYAPVSIALPFGIVAGLLAMRGGSITSVIGSFSTWGSIALGVGYLYAILVNLALRVAKQLKWVE